MKTVFAKEMIELYELHKPTTLEEVFGLTASMANVESSVTYLLSLMYRNHECRTIANIEEQLKEAREKRRRELGFGVMERFDYGLCQDQFYSNELVSKNMPPRYRPVIHFLSSKYLYSLKDYSTETEILTLLKETDYEVAYKHYLYTKGEDYYKTVIISNVKNEDELVDTIIDFVKNKVPNDPESISRALLKLLNDAIVDSHETYRKLYKRISHRALLD